MNKHCSPRYEKSFRHNNIHTLIRKLLQTKIPGTTIKLNATYIEGRKAYTTYRNHTSSQRQSKLAFHKAASFHYHYLTFTLQTYQHPEHRFRSWYTQMTSPSHLHIQSRVQPRNTYKHTYIKFWLDKTSHTKSSQNNTQFSPDPAEYKSNLDLKINKTALPMATHPKVLGLTLYPQLTYSTHIHNISL